jgi:hypothetical protein
VQIVFYFPLVSFPAAGGGGFEANENKSCAAHGRDLSLFLPRAQYRQSGHFFPLAAHLRCKHRNSKLQYQIISIRGLQRDVVYLG